MIKNKSVEITSQIVGLLIPLESEDRQRIIEASLILLGESPVSSQKIKVGSNGEENYGNLPERAQAWMKQNNLSLGSIQQVFQITPNGEVEIIAATIPGKSDKEKTLSAYILTGISKLLMGGEAAFDDKYARSICEAAGCYDSTNHASYVKAKSNEFIGNKDKGWTLTIPGLKRGAEIVMGLSKE